MESAEVYDTDGGVHGEINVFPTLVRLTVGYRPDRRSLFHGKRDPMLSRERAHVVTVAMLRVLLDVA